MTTFALVCSAYDKVIQWRRSVFLVPSGSTDMSEVACLLQAYTNSSSHSFSLKSIAVKTLAVLQVLLLQKPCCTSISIM